MSAQCPQTVPRTPANDGERQRKINVRLTCDFSLTGGSRRVESEALCEPSTALITQRSQVQILPPLQEKMQVRAGFVDFTDPASAFPCQHTVCGHCLEGTATGPHREQPRTRADK
jgi:hypothetical protein